MEIEHNIPLRRRHGSGVTALMRQMKVGDSFELDYDNTRQAGLYGQAKRVGIKVSVLQTGNGKMRVWRIE